MNAEVCCSSLPYSAVAYVPREPKAQAAWLARLSRSAGAVVQLVNAMARQLSVHRADTLRMAEFVAKEHYLARW